jgi:signal transduction histidine kinase
VPPSGDGSNGGLGSGGARKKRSKKHQKKGFPAIEGDSHALTQVLFNLVTNACKFCKKGSIRLTGRVVTASAKKDSNKATTRGVGVGASAEAIQQFVEIDVKDTGTVSGSFACSLSRLSLALFQSR